MNFAQFNKNQFEKIDWNINTKDFHFKKIGDFFQEGVKKVTAKGFFFTKSDKYGLQPVAILSDCLLNLPTHKRDTIKAVLDNKEAVNAIKENGCVLSFRQYNSKYGKICYDFDFTDETSAQPPIF